MGIHIGSAQGYKNVATMEANQVIIGNNEYVYDHRLVKVRIVDKYNPIFIARKISFKLWRK